MHGHRASPHCRRVAETCSLPGRPATQGGRCSTGTARRPHKGGRRPARAARVARQAPGAHRDRPPVYHACFLAAIPACRLLELAQTMAPVSCPVRPPTSNTQQFHAGSSKMRSVAYPGARAPRREKIAGRGGGDRTRHHTGQHHNVTLVKHMIHSRSTLTRPHCPSTCPLLTYPSFLIGAQPHRSL